MMVQHLPKTLNNSFLLFDKHVYVIKMRHIQEVSRMKSLVFSFAWSFLIRDHILSRAEFVVTYYRTLNVDAPIVYFLVVNSRARTDILKRYSECAGFFCRFISQLSSPDLIQLYCN